MLLHTPKHGHTNLGCSFKTELCEDTGCVPEELLGTINVCEDWRKRIRRIHRNWPDSREIKFSELFEPDEFSPPFFPFFFSFGFILLDKKDLSKSQIRPN